MHRSLVVLPLHRILDILQDSMRRLATEQSMALLLEFVSVIEWVLARGPDDVARVSHDYTHVWHPMFPQNLRRLQQGAVDRDATRDGEDVIIQRCVDASAWPRRAQLLDNRDDLGHSRSQRSCLPGRRARTPLLLCGRQPTFCRC